MRIGEIYEIQIENLWKCVFPFSLKKVPLGGAQEGILSKADFEF